MPLFQVGYRRYEGTRTPHWLRWFPITRAGLTISLRSKLLRRLVFVSFLPFLYFGWVFFVIGRITDPNLDASQGSLYDIAQDMFGVAMADSMARDPGAVRSAVWASVFAMFGSFFQLLLLGIVCALAGPSLVANDLRSRAFLIYFSRPISRADYILGKAGVLIALLASVTLLPSLLLYVLSILFSPSLDTIQQTLPVAGSIVAANLVTIVPASLIVLALSSLTRQPRFAAAAWAVICFFGPVAHNVLQFTTGLEGSSWTFLLSLPHTARALQLGLYDVGGRTSELALRGDLQDFVQTLSSTESPLVAASWLAFVSALSVFVLSRRVDAPTRI
jgi:ABC-type transport system involved in multi-copper enzyme maturation permease subunit